MEKLIQWLEQNVPSSSMVNESTITHGDIRIDNFVFHPTEPKVIAVLDWELCTIGSPWSDIAYNAMCYHLLPSNTGFTGLG